MQNVKFILYIRIYIYLISTICCISYSYSGQAQNNVDVGLVWIGNENIIQGQNNFSTSVDTVDTLGVGQSN